MTSTPVQSSIDTENDHVLLRRYADVDDRTALAELLRRYAPIVYSAARRQTRDATLAEDVAQIVFLAFARRAKSVRSGMVLGAWLMQTTRYAAANALKVQARRRHHERVASAARPEIDAHSDPADGSQRNWQSVEPVLDQAISHLPTASQTAIVLRFFRGMSLREIAITTGSTEEAARKRVGRAIQQLRKRLAGAGATPAACGAGELRRLLSTRALETPPAALLHHAASTAAAAPTGSASVLHGVLAMSASTKTAFGGVIALLILALGIAVAVIASMNSGSSMSSAAAPLTSDPAPAGQSGAIVLDIKAAIDGSDVLNITPDGAFWTHVAFLPPSNIMLNGKRFAPDVRPSLSSLGLSQADLSSAVVLHRRGRDTVTMEKTSIGLAIHFSDPESGWSSYEIAVSFAPQSAAAPSVAPAANPTTAPSSDSDVLDIKASISGSDVLTITSQGVHWQHVAAGWPSDLLLNDLPWDAQSTPTLSDIGLSNDDLTSARVIQQTGRDTLTLERTDNGVTIYFADAVGGSSPYEIKIRFSHVHKANTPPESTTPTKP